MESVFSITQLTSLTAVVAAAVGLTWVVKRLLGNIRVLNCVPVWVYTSTIAGALAYVANQVTGTLPGVTGYLIVDAIVLGALASGVRDWVKEGLTKPTGASGTAIQAREGSGDGRVTPRSWLLPLLLAGSMVALPACSAVKPPVITPEDQTQVRAVATKALAGIEVAGVIVRDGRQLVSDLATAGVVSVEVRSQVNAAVIRVNESVQPIITQLAQATRLVTVNQLVGQAYDAMIALADLLERQSDARVQTAGRFLRTAAGAVTALIGGAR
jgi:hypothetical protein